MSVRAASLQGPRRTFRSCKRRVGGLDAVQAGQRARWLFGAKMSCEDRDPSSPVSCQILVPVRLGHQQGPARPLRA